MNSEAAGPVGKIGVGFCFLGFFLGLACIILDKKMTIWRKFQTY